MRVAIPAETEANETRVAATPDSIKKLIALGATVVVQSGAGMSSGITDPDYVAAGATLAGLRLAAGGAQSAAPSHCALWQTQNPTSASRAQVSISGFPASMRD